MQEEKKENFCSCVAASCRFAEPISLKEFEAQFLSDVAGEPRTAVKRLTQRIEEDMTRLSINAPDWFVLYA